MKHKSIATAVLTVVFLFCVVHVQSSPEIKGTVFHDANRNGVQDKNELGLKNILVSNGADIVKTDNAGHFTILPLGHLPIFVIKPSGYQLSVSHEGQPIFYAQTDTLQGKNASFGLFKQIESKKARIALIGDLQPHNVDEIYYGLRTCVDELKAQPYDFSLTLGDNISDDPILYPLLKQSLKITERPIYYTLGNHDMDRNFPHKNGAKNWDTDYINHLGPTYYAFSWGNVNILTINNIFVTCNEQEKKSEYNYYMNEDQLKFIRNYFSHLDKNSLLIVSAHAKPDEIPNREVFYDLFKGFTNVLFVFGHYHCTENYTVGKQQGWPNETAARCIGAGAVCGGHWRGEGDMFGIPAAAMSDGTPKGYSFLNIEDGHYRFQYKASGMSIDKQLHIYTPDYLTWDTNFDPKDPTPDNAFYTNIYLGGEDTKVEYRIDGGEWQLMQKVNEADPYFKRLMLKQKLGIYPTAGERKLKGHFDDLRLSTHLWKAYCPPRLSYGVHELEVRYTDPALYNSAQKHSFIYLSPTLKKANEKLDAQYKKWVNNQ